ncbi:twin-arginine translocase TatA/TatE family subunit [Paenibacillus filicis]|uniref:Twin-arginine translocase TatA/TatE family subunit n=1 Tax=Paenibacillus filicis TaxID=669464 RepID=A0ABU9DSP7_9BACL
MNIGASGFILIIVVTLLLFGPSKLPQLGRAIGTTLSEFKAGARALTQDEDAGRRSAEKSGEGGAKSS